MNFLGWMDVEFILALDVLDILFDFAEIRGQRGPFLGRYDGPRVDAARFQAAGDHHGSGRVPLDYTKFFARAFEDLD